MKADEFNYEVLWSKVYADPHLVPQKNTDAGYDEGRSIEDWTLDDMYIYSNEDDKAYPPEYIYDGEDFEAAYSNYHDLCGDCKTYIGNGAPSVNALIIYDVAVFKCDDRVIAWYIKPLKEAKK